MSNSSDRSIGILISGRGSNMLALIDAVDVGSLNAEIAIVISNRADAAGIESARARGRETAVISHRGLSRDEHESAVVAELKKRNVSLVCLAGYMRLLSPHFVRAFPNRILNIHPSLLPSFPGLEAQRQALEYGVKVLGCTVHFVDEECDSGPILLQSAVPTLDSDTAETLAARILVEEHRIYPRAVQIALDGKYRIEGRRIILLND